MRKFLPQSIVSVFLIFTLLAPLSVLGQKKDSKEDDKDKREQKQEREERDYQKVLAKADKWYVDDLDFKDLVDQEYLRLQREQAEFAYLVNTQDQDDKLLVRTGDKVIKQDTLYDNPLAQDYINRLGQSLVPEGSSKLYAFRITLNPILEARSYSTGTVYVSSGLLSLVENEAQLAYILSHEISHIEKDHWFEDVRYYYGVQKVNKEKEKKRGWISLATMGVGGALGGADGAFLGVVAGVIVGKLTVRKATVSWERFQEDAADQMALELMIKRRYDVREVPKIYDLMKTRMTREPKAQLGFMGKLERLNERIQKVTSFLREDTNAQQLTSAGKGVSADVDPKKRLNKIGASIKGRFDEDIQKLLDSGELIGSEPEFKEVMAQIRRDNGWQAFYFDMFQMSSDNLKEAIDIRSNDPLTHYYLGRVLKQTARNPAQRREALSLFTKAIQLDQRGAIPEPHLYYALTLLESRDSNQWGDATQSLKNYVVSYQRAHGGNLPPNMEVIYSFMQEAGERAWLASPVGNVRDAQAISFNANQTPSSASTATTQPNPTTTKVEETKQPVKQPPANTKKKP
jgi:predicted Zn-dependent protease